MASRLFLVDPYRYSDGTYTVVCADVRLDYPVVGLGFLVGFSDYGRVWGTGHLGAGFKRPVGTLCEIPPAHLWGRSLLL